MFQPSRVEKLLVQLWQLDRGNQLVQLSPHLFRVFWLFQHESLSSQNLEKGKRVKAKRLVWNVLGTAEPFTDVPSRRCSPAPARGPEFGRSIGPGATAEYALIFLFVIPVSAPLQDIPGHVIAAIGADPVGILGDGRGLPVGTKKRIR